MRLIYSFFSFKELLKDVAAPKTNADVDSSTANSNANDNSASASALTQKTGNAFAYADAKIQVAKLDGAFRVTIVDSNIVKPMSVVVHPFRGKLFWSDHGDDDVDFKIEASDMDGGNRLTLSDRFASSSEASRVQSPVRLVEMFASR